MRPSICNLCILESVSESGNDSVSGAGPDPDLDSRSDSGNKSAILWPRALHVHIHEFD